MATRTLPKTGNDADALRALVRANREALFVLMLYGSFQDRYGERDTLRRLKNVTGQDVDPVWLPTLYGIALEEADRITKRPL
jgi:hypothetical protein